MRSLIAFAASFILRGCISALQPAPLPDPPPGWNSPLTELFVELESLPEGWGTDPQVGDIDVRVNNVGRTFFDLAPNGSGKVHQVLWRAYTVSDAETRFTERSQALRARGWLPRYPSTRFGPIREITYQSRAADQWGLACGIDVIAECWFLGRYHNYVTFVYFTLEDDEYDGLSFAEAGSLLAGVDEQFRETLGLAETTLDNPSYLTLMPADSNTSESSANTERLLLDADALPHGWQVTFVDWEGATVLPSGEYLASRNYARDDCYAHSPHFESCHITQFVTWYPSALAAQEQWRDKYSELNVGDPAQLGVWRVPSDVASSDWDADQSFVACSEVAGGESCEAILRFDTYLIALIADMYSPTTLMGHSQYGLTHDAFERLVDEAALHAQTVLHPEN